MGVTADALWEMAREYDQSIHETTVFLLTFMIEHPLKSIPDTTTPYTACIGLPTQSSGGNMAMQGVASMEDIGKANLL